MKPNSPFFRPDIEGLRAVAVLLVIGAHYGVPGLAGGFIGVDIFFVISGYLISSILVREHENTGHISLKRFYINRLRRLLPALLSVLICTSVAVAWLFPASTHLAQSRTAIAATLWASNLQFAFQELDYFAADVSSNAYLHTWSLGVEEQFYLLWPLLLIWVLPWAKDRSQRLAAFWMGLAIWSLVLSLLWTTYLQSPMLAFYMMPARAWQFAAGALVWWRTRQRPASLSQAVWSGWAGAALIGLSLIVITPQTTYPGLWALLPTLGAAALLWAGAANHTHLIKKGLSASPMQAVGHLSYALYLWHWPAMVIGQYLYTSYGLPELPEQKFFFLLASLLFSLMAAILTHRLIENPIRFGKPAQLRLGVQLLLALGLMAATGYQFWRWHNDAKNWQIQNGNSETGITLDTPVIYQHGCDSSFSNDILNPCIYGNKNAQKTVILIGDSVGAQWFPAIARMHNPNEWKIVVLTKSSCPIVDEPYFSQRLGREFTECASWRNQTIEWLQKNPAQRLFIGSTQYDFSPEKWTQGTLRVLERIVPHMQSIYILEATPQLPFFGPNCLQQRGPEQYSAKFNDPRHAIIATALKQAIAQYENVHWLTTVDFVCPEGLCWAQRKFNDKEIAVFRDEQHITASFAAEAASYFLDQIKD